MKTTVNLSAACFALLTACLSTGSVAAQDIPAHDAKDGFHVGVIAVAFSPDGKKIISGGYDNHVRVWDAASGKQLEAWLSADENAVYSVAFSPDGKKYAFGTYGGMAYIHDAKTGEGWYRLSHASGVARRIAFSPDSKKMAVAINRIVMWDVDTGKELYDSDTYDGTHSVCFSPDGKTLVAGCDDGKTGVRVKIWDVGLKTVLRDLQGHREGHTNQVEAVAFSPDGKRIVSGGHDGMARIWDAKSGRELFIMKHDKSERGDDRRVETVAFSPDGKKVITGSQDETARIWDADSGKELQKFEMPPLKAKKTNEVNSVAFSPDGKKVALGCSDGFIRIRTP